jgi:cytochrome c nitrite reductase small subunit
METTITPKSKIKRLLEYFYPPPRWKVPVIIMLGIICGLSLQIFYISNAISYLSDEPATCVNCHVMSPQYATWMHGSHGRVTTCNDCHVPHNNIFNKYLFKATDGLRHSFMFTFRLEPQVIQIKQAGKDAVQKNCIRCHSNVIHPIGLRGITNNSMIDYGDGYCWKCHRETPHGRVSSLASTPFAPVPKPAPVLPAWLSDYINSKEKK